MEYDHTPVTPSLPSCHMHGLEGASASTKSLLYKKRASMEPLHLSLNSVKGILSYPSPLRPCSRASGMRARPRNESGEHQRISLFAFAARKLSTRSRISRCHFSQPAILKSSPSECLPLSPFPSHMATI